MTIEYLHGDNRANKTDAVTAKVNEVIAAVTVLQADGGGDGGSQPSLRGPYTITEAAILAAWDTDHADLDAVADLADGEVIFFAWVHVGAEFATPQTGYGYFDAYSSWWGDNSPFFFDPTLFAADDAQARVLTGGQVNGGSINGTVAAIGAVSLGLRFFQEPLGDTGSADIYLLVASSTAP